MKKLTKLGLLGLLLSQSMAAATSLVSVPAEGLILKAGQRLTVAGSRYVLGAAGGTAQITSYKTMFSRPPHPGVYRLERNRKHERDKALNQKQGGTFLKGIATHLIYKKGKEHAKKSKAQAKQGKGSESIAKSLLKGLFK